MNDLPGYVERGSKQTFVPPYRASGARIYGFILESDPAALGELLDRALNRPSGGRTAYRPGLPLVFLTFADILSLASTTPPDSRIGWVPERDVAFWVLGVATKKEGPVEVAESIAFYQPYLFVDSPQALLTGREVQGFPKEYANIDMTREESNTGSMSVRTHVFPKFEPTTEIQVRELMRVSPVPGSVGDADLSRFETLAELLAYVGKEVLSGAAKVPLPGLKFLFELREELANKEVPCVFLKQFRDARDGARACYQAIVHVPMRVTAFRGGGLLPGRYRLELADFASHPIAKELGLARESFGSLLGAYIDIDFELERGDIVWEAGSAR